MAVVACIIFAGAMMFLIAVATATLHCTPSGDYILDHWRCGVERVVDGVL
jgi:hypothetical protein